MTARQETKLNMYNTVIQHCDNNAATVATIPAFEAAVTALKATRDLIEAKRNFQAQPISGTTEDKNNARTGLEDAAVAIASKGYAFAVNTNNMDLKEQFNYTKSDLQRLRDGELDGVCQNIHDAADANAAALVSYGIVAGDITGLKDLIDAYKAIVTGPRTKIGNRSAAKDDLKTLFKQADNTLKQQMDKLAIGFKTSHPDFYNQYLAARVIVDAPTQKKEETPPPTP
jgi:hypothetical protein